MSEKDKVTELIRKLPEREQTLVYYMVLGAAFALRKKQQRKRGD